MAELFGYFKRSSEEVFGKIEWYRFDRIRRRKEGLSSRVADMPRKARALACMGRRHASVVRACAKDLYGAVVVSYCCTVHFDGPSTPL